MSFGDVLYVIAIVLFAYLTFGIVRGYFKSKFDDEGRRIDMIEDEEEKKYLANEQELADWAESFKEKNDD